MKKQSQYLNFLLATDFGIALFFYFNYFFRYHFAYREEMQLFLFSSEYFKETVLFPGGLCNYFDRFLTQFFYFPWLGALIFTILLIALQQITLLVLNRFLRKTIGFVLSFIPALFYAYLLCEENYMIGGLIAAIVVLLFTYFGCLIKKPPIRWSYQVGMVLFLYLIAGGSVVLFVVLSVIYEFIQPRKKGNRFIIPIIGMLVIMVLCPVVFKMINPYHPLTQYIWGTELFRGLKDQPGQIPYFWLSIIGIILLTICFSKIQSGKTETISAIVFGMLILGISIPLFGFRVKELARKQEIMKYDYLCRMRQWDEIIQLADKKSPNRPMTVTCLNLALQQTGQLPDKMFNYYQNGAEGLIPSFQRDFLIMLIAAEPYYYTGHVNFAQRCVFEAMEAIPDYQKSGRCLKRLAETNLINGTYGVAEKYIALLEKTIFYRKWAQDARTYLYNDIKVESHPEWGLLRNYRPTKDFIYFDGAKTQAMVELFESNKGNKAAYEYMMAFAMLNKDFPGIETFYTLEKNFNYPTVPRHYQEAMAFIWSQQNLNPELRPDGISDQTLQRLSEFHHIYVSYQNSEPYSQAFKNTFWYYIFYNK